MLPASRASTPKQEQMETEGRGTKAARSAAAAEKRAGDASAGGDMKKVREEEPHVGG